MQGRGVSELRMLPEHAGLLSHSQLTTILWPRLPQTLMYIMVKPNAYLDPLEATK